jgi:hypothetical protein
LLEQFRIFNAALRLGQFTSTQLAKESGVAEGTVQKTLRRRKDIFITVKGSTQKKRGGQSLHHTVRNDVLRTALQQAADAVEMPALPAKKTGEPLGLILAEETLYNTFPRALPHERQDLLDAASMNLDMAGSAQPAAVAELRQLADALSVLLSSQTRLREMQEADKAVRDASLAAIESLLSLEERNFRETDSSRCEYTTAALAALPSTLASLHSSAEKEETASLVWARTTAAAWFLLAHRRWQPVVGDVLSGLAGAEKHTRDIARTVEVPDADSIAASRQHDVARVPEADESNLTAPSMRELRQQAIQDRDAIFKQSADSFAAMMHATMQIGSELQQELQELKTVRGELRHELHETQREAATNTLQMRKLIVDQIETLAELNRIVARRGRESDLVSLEEQPMLATAGGRSQPRSTPRSASNLPPPDLGMPSSRRTEAPPVSRASSDQGRDGWLSDLLSRADTGGDDRDVPRGRTPQQAAGGNPLETLSLDISGLTDRNLAAEMWDRYQRGEAKAFSNRLYTPAGQKAFDEVSRRYRADHNFKQTVDRYIQEFERLLDEAARDERGPAALRGHLTSETGLVYTLLAHAAGRLG